MNADTSGSMRAFPIGEFVLGLLPFVLIGAGTVLFSAPYKPFPPGQPMPGILAAAGLLLLGGFLLITAVLLWGWLRGFPRWSMPYLIYATIFALYLSAAATPGVVLFGIEMWGGEPWGLRACVPFGLVALLSVLFSRSPWKPIEQLFRGIWNDWTYLAFGLYGLLPLLVLIIQDEIDHSYTLYPTLIAMLVTIAGAALYLIFSRRAFRGAFLIGGWFLAVLAASFSSNYYWQTRMVDMQTFEITPLFGPVPWSQIITGALTGAAMLTLVLALTGVVGLLHYMVNKNAAKSAG